MQNMTMTFDGNDTFKVFCDGELFGKVAYNSYWNSWGQSDDQFVSEFRSAKKAAGALVAAILGKLEDKYYAISGKPSL